MSEVLKIQGRIEDIKVTGGKGKNGRDWTRTQIEVDGLKMACFSPLDFELGDNVIVYYTNDGKYNTIESMEYVNSSNGGQSSQSSLSSPPQNKDKLIVRQSCLKAASIACQHAQAVNGVELILKTAEEFEKWVWRE